MVAATSAWEERKTLACLCAYQLHIRSGGANAAGGDSVVRLFIRDA